MLLLNRSICLIHKLLLLSIEEVKKDTIEAYKMINIIETVEDS